MSWWTDLIGRKRPAPVVATEELDDEDPRVERGYEMLDAHWRTMGAVDPMVLTYASMPQFMDVPPWPAGHQGYHIIRAPGGLILSSAGLAAPFLGTDITDRSGFGIEVFVEFPGVQADTAYAVDRNAHALIETVGRNVAADGGFDEILDRLGKFMLSLELKDRLGARWSDAAGKVWALLGLDVPGRSARLELPFGPVRIVSVTPLLPDEAEVYGQGPEGRQAVAEGLMRQGVAGRFEPERASVLA